MLLIRAEQFRIVANDSLKRWLASHLRRHFARFSLMTEQHLLNFVDCGILRAAGYRITSPRGVSRYLDVMAAYGEDFDVRADCQWWAGTILRSAETLSEDRLTSLLAETAVRALRERS